MTFATSWYRIQRAGRDPRDLLTAGQTSHYWGRDDLEQSGVSVCETLDDLALYLATAGQGIPIGDGDWVIVELAGELLGSGHDDGEFLIQPTALLSVTSAADDFFDLVGHHYDQQ